MELLKLSVPSVVYAVQNNMAFVALSNLDAAVYQVSEHHELRLRASSVISVHSDTNIDIYEEASRSSSLKGLCS